ncbi:peptidase A24A prepilin type IV (plasmid) [Xylanimonas cellulosilytica DSM 15894]|uniref:Peptidase A24A prepilin type IV n=1 Tax=Xylanimonas cellulosilytica (strain DSM 15894 / JCM 12276 / CECT 5975 / KCTC 9989 / LMG 20990 / NBRC 107835 / XIL07) TaxID=446471 RepID=D1C0T7_XYLCX|nr:prepilin peptidase [Xylanimonas cellulosilytica]ACZ32403.1 peptidase A24A prepilin type IV [Xylanimonas cellulosilytica DSM 15894]
MSWWVLAGAITGALAGVAGWHRLRTGTYRRDDDVARLPLKHAWVLVPLAAAGGAVAGLTSGPLRAAAWLYLVVGAAIIWIDLDVHRIPDAITRWWAPALAAVLLVSAAITGQWEILGWAAAGAGVLGGLFFVLALVSSMGLGDVKLAAITGLLLGPLGWSGLLTAALAAFLLPALAALVLLARGAGRRAHLAFGPGIVAGAAVAMTLATSAT